MTLRLFEGPAGSGKTTMLFQAVGEHLAHHPLDRDQRVLALTKMHGSRRRMHGKLAEVLGKGSSSECATLNSFALGLVQRWRSLARTVVDPLPADTDFAGIAEVAAALLARDAVVRWVAARHPLLVVDELQDLRGTELAVIKGLSRGLNVLCAADEFQDLDPQGVCEGVEWARSHGDVVPLVQVHRTNAAGLLAAARGLRDGTGVVDGTGFKVFATPKGNIAASFMARNLTRYGGSQHSILSPTGPEKSSFVAEALARLAEKPFEKDGKRFGPFDVPWEAAAHHELRAWAAVLDLDNAGVVSAAAILAREHELPGPLIDWVRSRARLVGQFSFDASVVREQIGRAHASIRAHGSAGRLHRTGLTVHQAKNREFERVIVLWPIAVGGGAEVQRRLLYNAITRAKRDCVVLVQDPKKTRLAGAPFSIGA